MTTTMQLIIQTFGVKVNIENGVFLLRSNDTTQKIPACQVGSMVISKGCSISSNVIFYAAEHHIDILFSAKDGKPAARLWSTRFGSVATIRKQQLRFVESAQALAWVIDLYSAKIRNQQAVLNLLYHPSKQFDQLLDDSILFLAKYTDKLSTLLQSDSDKTNGTLRGWEGVCSRKYFRAIATCIPSLYYFDVRSQHPALDMFNALLNYAYGILYGLVESALIQAGIDPSIGIFHRDEYNKPVLVYDVIERFRFWADIVVIQLCMQEVIFPDFFTEKDGGIWLEKEGRQLLISTFNDYMSEVVDMNGIERNRKTHIYFYCTDLAKQFTSFSNP